MSVVLLVLGLQALLLATALWRAPVNRRANRYLAILKRLLPLARADGSNDATRGANLEVTGEERLSAFDVYRALTTPAAAGELRLRVRAFGGAARELGVIAMTEAERQAARAGDAGDEAARWRFAIGSDGVAVLRMPSWAVFNDKSDWKPRLDGFLDRVVNERAHGLVVDLRGNEGGLDCGDRILARLIDRDLVLPAYVNLTRYRSAPPTSHRCSTPGTSRSSTGAPPRSAPNPTASIGSISSPGCLPPGSRSTSR